MTTSFTEGTKVQIEQALVANGLNTTILQDGLAELVDDNLLHGGAILAEKAKKLGFAVSDYLISPNINPGVVIVAEHNSNQRQG